MFRGSWTTFLTGAPQSSLSTHGAETQRRTGPGCSGVKQQHWESMLRQECWGKNMVLAVLWRVAYYKTTQRAVNYVTGIHKSQQPRRWESSLRARKQGTWRPGTGDRPGFSCPSFIPRNPPLPPFKPLTKQKKKERKNLVNRSQRSKDNPASETESNKALVTQQQSPNPRLQSTTQAPQLLDGSG